MNIKTIILEKNKLGVAYFEYRLINVTNGHVLARCDAMSGDSKRAKMWGDRVLHKIITEQQKAG